LTVSDEKDRVRLVVRRLFADGADPVDVGSGKAALVTGAAQGDDCAVFECEGEFDLVIGSDYVRGPKFTLYELGYLSLHDLGYYLAAANLSDIAAMGARPIGLTSVVRYPNDMSDGDFEQVMRGIRDAARDHNTQNVGGDIGGAERLILSASAIGIAPRGRVLHRSGARPGDHLFVSGPVGNAGAAVIYFSQLKPTGRVLPDALEQELLRPWRRPRARIDIGTALASSGIGTACQDISDGLRATLDELSTSSAVGLVVDLDHVPVGAGVAAVADLLEVDKYSLALSASVDFELVFTAPPEAEARETLSKAGLECFAIGRAVESGGPVAIRDGLVTDLPGVAWRHQVGDVAANIVQGLEAPASPPRGS
jgi:thiamine-monophosphate kinase